MRLNCLSKKTIPSLNRIRVMKYILSLIVLFGLLSSFLLDKSAVQLETSWEKIIEFDLDSTAKWEVDALGFIYVSQGGEMTKYDDSGDKLFEQGLKSLGSCSDLLSLNPSKFLHFSEEQQTVCYFDNTLSFTNDCVDLSEYGIENAGLVSTSAQPDKIWVMDNLGYRLVLLSLNKTLQGQEIKNLRSILNMDSIVQIIERGNSLYLLDPNQGVFVFDIYGTFIEKISEVGISHIDANEKSLFMIRDDVMILRMMKTGDQAEIKLPITKIQRFKYKKNRFYFSNNKKLSEFELQILD